MSHRTFSGLVVLKYALLALDACVVGRTSSDLIEWRVCRTLLTDDTGFTPADSATYTGFE